MKKNILLLAAGILSSLFMAACGSRNGDIPADLQQPGMFGGYSSVCQYNLYRGRAYAAQGRYELAKEHLLLALAQSTDDVTRRVAGNELKSVEMSILTLR
ncbi:MAG: hypothetical protein LBQ51_03735 [Desulfovibrio sp.]|jgi:hypothetical protein|nr:hypothetical protein [Desulfovibrio sp.]